MGCEVTEGLSMDQKVVPWMPGQVVRDLSSTQYKSLKRSGQSGSERRWTQELRRPAIRLT